MPCTRARNAERIPIDSNPWLHMSALAIKGMILAARTGSSRDASEKRRPVGLCRNEPEPPLSLLKFVDQVQLVVPLHRPLVRLRRRITDRGQDQHQSRQPLLPVHDQVGRSTARSGRNRRQDDAAQEMPRLA